ncbi:MAG: DUF937 domain-containing protein [Steroidobacteraceae bacterium]
MNLIESVLAAGGGSLVSQMARQFGTQPGQTQDAIAQITQVLGQGLARNSQSSGGLEALLGALAGGNHQRYLDDLSSLGSAAGIADGNGILGHILGSKDVSRSLADRVGSNTGVGAAVVKQMLPMIAGLVLGSLGKQHSQGALAGLTRNAPAAGRSPLGALLDADGDGSIADDLLDLAGKFLRR